MKTFSESVDFLEDEDILGIAELSDGNIAVSGYSSEVIKVRGFTMNGKFVGKFESGKLRDPGGTGADLGGGPRGHVTPPLAKTLRIFFNRALE